MSRNPFIFVVGLLALFLWTMPVSGQDNPAHAPGTHTEESGEHHADGAEHDQDPAHADDHDDHGHGDHDDHGHGDGHHHDEGMEKAAGLAVHEPPSWYRSVIAGAVTLFVLAMFLGSFAIITKGPEPPDPADDHGHGDGHH